jgi:hypothetical protein
LTVHAQLRLILRLSDGNLNGLAWHIHCITALALAFVVVGGLFCWGGPGLSRSVEPGVRAELGRRSWAVG